MEEIRNEGRRPDFLVDLTEGEEERQGPVMTPRALSSADRSGEEEQGLFGHSETDMSVRSPSGDAERQRRAENRLTAIFKPRKAVK